MSHLVIDEQDGLRQRIRALDLAIEEKRRGPIVDLKELMELRHERHALVMRLSVVEDRNR